MKLPALVSGVAAALALSATPALAATVTAPAPAAPLASCANPDLSQPFAGVKDNHYYTLAPVGAARQRGRGTPTEVSTCMWKGAVAPVDASRA